ncbi:MAG: hypothetical protein SFW67_23595 [Myxococcaceae bacterium]|nr:hypothetical protein [Myxococcaceae bacterium]
MRRSVIFLSVLSTVLMLAIAQGCGASTCSEANCGGCCDANGRCASGSTPDLCGKAGARCNKCPDGAQCLQQVCTIVQGTGGGTGGGMTAAGGAAGGSTGGGSAGGGAAGGSTVGGGTAGGGVAGGGSGGGAPTGCRSIDLIEGSMLMGGGTRTTMSGTQTAWFTAWPVPVSPGSNITLRLDVQLYRPVGTQPMLPVTGSFSSSTRFRTCDECIQLANTCDLVGDNCVGGNMIARAGSFQFTAASSNTLAGSFQHLLFRPWDLTTDMPVASDTNCIYVRSLTFDARW